MYRPPQAYSRGKYTAGSHADISNTWLRPMGFRLLFDPLCRSSSNAQLLCLGDFIYELYFSMLP